MKMTSSHHWRTFTGRIVFFLIISLAAAGPDDTAASASADASPITEEYQKFAVSLKPSEVWYVPTLPVRPASCVAQRVHTHTHIRAQSNNLGGKRGTSVLLA